MRRSLHCGRQDLDRAAWSGPGGAHSPFARPPRALARPIRRGPAWLAFAFWAGQACASAKERCTHSCDARGQCIPLRYIWGAQKAGTTSLNAMLQTLGACGGNALYTGILPVPTTNAKETHYLTWTTAPSRHVYAGTFLSQSCSSLCFVEATPDNLISPLAAARLRFIMTEAEAVSALCRQCFANAAIADTRFCNCVAHEMRSSYIFSSAGSSTFHHPAARTSLSDGVLFTDGATSKSQPDQRGHSY